MYNHSIRVSGQTSAYRFCALFNPVGSGMQMVLRRITVTPYATASSLSSTPLLLSRITSSTGGVLMDAGDVNKFDNTYPDTAVEMRMNNPTVTLAQEVYSFAPPIQALTVSGYAPVLQAAEFPEEWGRFVLAEGEGVAYHQTTGGLTSHVYAMTAFWSEQAS